MGKTWSPAEDKLLAALVFAGHSTQQIAEALSRTEMSTLNRRKKLKIRFNRRHWTNHDKSLFVKLAQEGKTASDIAKIINRSETQVRTFARCNKIHLERGWMPSTHFKSETEIRQFLWNKKIMPYIHVLENGCHELHTTKNSKTGKWTYGTVRTSNKSFRAHRIALEIKLGRILTSEEMSCHECDNPPCVNPNHLFLGDHKINAADMAAKDRSFKGAYAFVKDHAKGERQHRAVLTTEKVVKIRLLHNKQGVGITELSKQFNVSKGAIAGVIKYRTWKHIK